jgi:hypothetical protein
LLQRNIRVDQRDTATNRSIEGTCAGGDSANFLHFNNGVTFICDKADWDPFQKTLTLECGFRGDPDHHSDLIPNTVPI